jgi:protein AIR1/2
VQHERRLRDWERDDDQFGDWGKHAPNNVGRQGRKKMMERMRKSAQRFEEENDPEDWFRSAKNRSTTSIPTQPRLMRERVKERPRGGERQNDRDTDTEWGRRDSDRDKERRRGTDQDRERDRRRDIDSRDRGRGRGRDEDLGRERHRERERDRDRGRDRDRDGERDQGRERNHVQDEGQRRHPHESSKVKIKFSSDRVGPPSLHPGLPPRPPSLLARLSDIPQEESQPLSIKGAGQKRSRDDRRRNYQPQYRGGYS